MTAERQDRTYILHIFLYFHYVIARPSASLSLHRKAGRCYGNECDYYL